MKTGIVIQARKGSTRLPNKMVLPFDQEKGVMEIILEKLIQHYKNFPIILATTDLPQDDELEEIAIKHGIHCLRGSENDVLERFIETGEKWKLDNIIRVCADNPFLDMPHIAQLINEINTSDKDYVSFKNNHDTPVIQTHLGLFTEAVKLSSLKKVQEKTKDKHYREHVTNYIYEHPDMFEIKLMNLPPVFKETENIRLTLDSPTDFQLEKELYKKYKHLDTETLIELLKKEKSIQEKMKDEIMKNKKG
jgi:spore coat polysaccharide biosynthesis protein SpsF